jgi:hypothetical protein
MRTFDLNVSSPEQVEGVLLAAAQEFNESADMLVSAWQDKQAGRAWRKIARALQVAAAVSARAAAEVTRR